MHPSVGGYAISYGCSSEVQPLWNLCHVCTWSGALRARNIKYLPPSPICVVLSLPQRNGDPVRSRGTPGRNRHHTRNVENYLVRSRQPHGSRRDSSTHTIGDVSTHRKKKKPLRSSYSTFARLPVAKECAARAKAQSLTQHLLGISFDYFILREKADSKYSNGREIIDVHIIFTPETSVCPKNRPVEYTPTVGRSLD